MEIEYADQQLERVCTETKVAKRTHGEAISKGLARRIAQIRSADSVEDLLTGPGNWHWLTQDLDGHLSGRITGNWRVVVKPLGVDGRDATAVAVEVISVKDYH